jgi:hypothetical protein
MLFAMPLLCKATSRAAREGEERFRRSLALLVLGKGEPPKVGEIPEGVAPCFHLTLEMARRFYVKDYKELKDARVLRFLEAACLLAWRGESVSDMTKCRQ